MSTWMKFLVVSGVMAAVSFGSQLQAAGASDARNAQAKLMAQRAARVDAIRKLSERINGLAITSKTTVKDFVTENDTIRASMVAFLNGMKETKVDYKEDGTCEVTMEVTLVEVITTLKQVYNAHYKGDHYKVSDFQEMTQTNNIKVLTETGNGAPPAVADEVGETTVIPKEGLGKIIGWGPRAKAYWMANVKPQGRLMALRAARIDGMRRLVERIAGTVITSDTIVRDFVTEKDDINAFAQALLVGAREQSVRYHDEEPIVEIEMAVTLQTVVDTIKSMTDVKFKGNKVKLKEFEERTREITNKVITETGMGCVGENFMIGDSPEVMDTAKTVMNWPVSISETGSGAVDTANENKAQAKLMAKRAAEMDARRKLAEKLDGLIIRSKTTVKDFVTESDKIKASMQTYQQGAYVVEGSYKELEDGTWECTVAIDTAPLWDLIIRYDRKK